MSRAPMLAVALAYVFLAACSTESPVAQPTTPSKPPPIKTSPTPSATPYVFPVVGKASYGRTHHDYAATDIIAACGSPVVSPVSGVVLEVSRVDTWDATVDDGATRGGLYASILGDDGVRYYAAHFATLEASITPGVRVTAGQPLATVGTTGRSSACHVHIGMSPPCAETRDWWIRRGVIWPWPYLDAWLLGERLSPAAETAEWRSAHGCPPAP